MSLYNGIQNRLATLLFSCDHENPSEDMILIHVVSLAIISLRECLLNSYWLRNISLGYIKMLPLSEHNNSSLHWFLIYLMSRLCSRITIILWSPKSNEVRIDLRGRNILPRTICSFFYPFTNMSIYTSMFWD